MTDQKRAVILLSGGLDSATLVAMVRAQGYRCYSMSFDYGQRHRAELNAAARVARDLGVVEHKVVGLNLGGMGGSALTDSTIGLPEAPSEGIPVTYVPARNTVFLSLALGWAEVLNARDIFIGVNALDYSGYPDCRPEYVESFERMANLATKAGVEGQGFRIQAPLQNMSKADNREGWRRTWRRLRADCFLLSGRRRRSCLWEMRRLPTACRGLPNGRNYGPNALFLIYFK